MVIASQNFDGVFGYPVKLTIDPAYWFTSVTKLARAGPRLFLLDASDTTASKGTIAIFKVTDDAIVGETIFVASDFGTADRINDFEILPTVLQPEQFVLLVTLNNYGLGYGVFDPTIDQFSLKPIGAVMLQKDDRLAEHQLQANNYLQIEYLDQTNTP